MSNSNFKLYAPNTFQCPNDLVDHWMPHLKEGELKVLLVIIRKTLGWHKIRDKISISQLMQFTGMSRPSVIDSSDSLASKGIIIKETLGKEGSQETYYELVITQDSNYSYQSKINTPPSKKSEPPPVKNFDPQQTSSLNTSFQEQQQAKPKVFDCLLAVDVDVKEKEWITENYDEETVKHAISYTLHPETKISTTVTKTLKWACKAKPELPKPKVKKLSRREQFEQAYKNNGQYNGADCWINEEGFTFQRGYTIHSLIWNAFDYDDRLVKILEFVNKRG